MIGPLFGLVTRRHGRYFVIEIADAPAHLRIMDLAPSQMCGADVGARVRLEYQTTARSGLWNVTAVLPEGEAALAAMERRFAEVETIRQAQYWWFTRCANSQPVDPAITREWYALSAQIAMAKRLL